LIFNILVIVPFETGLFHIQYTLVSLLEQYISMEFYMYQEQVHCKRGINVFSDLSISKIISPPLLQISNGTNWFRG